MFSLQNLYTGNDSYVAVAYAKYECDLMPGFEMQQNVAFIEIELRLRKT